MHGQTHINFNMSNVCDRRLSEYGALVKWYWQEKTEEVGEKPVTVLLLVPEIPNG